MKRTLALLAFGLVLGALRRRPTPPLALLPATPEAWPLD